MVSTAFFRGIFLKNRLLWLNLKIFKKPKQTNFRNQSMSEDNHSQGEVDASKLSRCLTLFRIFAGISAVALGGGLIMLPVATREFVDRRGWLTQDDMLDMVAIIQSLPGIIAVNMSSLIGFRIAGIAGAACGTLGVIFPPFVVILIIAYCLTNFLDHPYLAGVFLGVRAGVCAMILFAVIRMGKQAIRGWFEAVLALFGFIGVLVFDINAALLVVIAGCVGFCFQSIRQRLVIDSEGGKQ